MAGIKWGKNGKTENQKNQPPCQHLGPPPTTTVPRNSAVSSSAHNQTCLEPEPPGMRVAALPLAPLRAAKQLLHNTVSSAANSTRSPVATTLIDPYHHARPPITTGRPPRAAPQETKLAIPRSNSPQASPDPLSEPSRQSSSTLRSRRYSTSVPVHREL